MPKKKARSTETPAVQPPAVDPREQRQEAYKNEIRADLSEATAGAKDMADSARAVFGVAKEAMDEHPIAAGAAKGALIGSFIPGVGTLIGGAIGAYAGKRKAEGKEGLLSTVFGAAKEALNESEAGKQLVDKAKSAAVTAAVEIARKSSKLDAFRKK